MILYLILLLFPCKRLAIIINIALAYLQNAYISLRFNTTTDCILNLIRFSLTLINQFFPSNLGIIIETVLGNIH